MRLKSMASGRAQIELTLVVLLIAFSLTFAGALAQGNITGFFIENETLANISSFIDDLAGNTSEVNEVIADESTNESLNENLNTETNSDNTTTQEENITNETEGNTNATENLNNETSNEEGNETEIPIDDGDESASNDTISDVADDNATVLTTTTFDIAVIVPQKITRGELVRASATITNTGSATAKGIILSWKLPEGFTIISSSTDCSALSSGESCTASAEIQTSFSAALGQGEIRIVVNYET